jgi:hypothetical protein
MELVALLEAATPQAPLRRFRSLTKAVADARNSERSTLGRGRAIVDAVLQKLVDAIARQGEQWWVSARFHLLHQVLARQLPWPGFIRELSPLQICESAGARYVPRPLCNASVVLVRAKRQSIISDIPYRVIYADEKLGWGTIIQDLAVVDVDGGHSTMLQEPFVRDLVVALMPYVNHKSAPSAIIGAAKYAARSRGSA